MKLCPKCGNVYTDDTLSFCLSDGNPLVDESSGEKTEQLPNLVIDLKTKDESLNKTNQTNFPTEQTAIRTINNDKKKGVSPIWIFATFGLLGIILIGGLGIWFVMSGNSNSNNAESNSTFGDNTVSNENNSIQNNENLAKQTPTIPTNTPIPEKTVIPTPTPNKTLYRVRGVASNDVLYIRPSPGNTKVVVGKIPPNGTGIIVTGGGKKAGKSVWYPVNYNGIKGWVSGNYITKQ